jgi:tRNA (guanine-N7-)-methyltransferase
VACADAKLFLRDRVVPGTVRAVHVYFPDPWWKKRHHKRRLFTPEFVDVVARVLTPTGRLHLVTDVAEYFARMIETMAGRPDFARLGIEALPGLGEGEYLTNFERKYRIEGRPIHRAAYEMTPTTCPTA